jgi:hypothetical protein
MPAKTGPKPIPFEDRYVPEPNSGCWLWIGARRNHYGYGVLRMNGQNYQAHRVAYERWRGQIPADMELDHLCRLPACVNPNHLEVVTHQDNMLRGQTVVADHARKLVCPTCGGPYTETHRMQLGRRRGERVCPPCRRVNGVIRSRRYRERLRFRNG